MAEYRLTRKAKADLLAIVECTREKWGRSQVGAYIDSIEAQCQMLANNPSMGNGVNAVAADLLRYPIENHVIFYKRQSNNIVIVRVLHKRMLPDNYI